ncbi:hypothetical protein OIU76_013313 [Salix suchowensis]|nr:hypothetical protein OIU76_013313 [Salix suchowensis]KAJ6350324.1 hypothetical protein OIU78_006484 [Salix suchowensis]
MDQFFFSRSIAYQDFARFKSIQGLESLESHVIPLESTNSLLALLGARLVLKSTIKDTRASFATLKIKWSLKLSQIPEVIEVPNFSEEAIRLIWKG